MIHVKITANKYVTAAFAVRMAKRSDILCRCPQKTPYYYQLSITH